jgi:hypothetical protein
LAAGANERNGRIFRRLSYVYRFEVIKSMSLNGSAETQAGSGENEFKKT